MVDHGDFDDEDDVGDALEDLLDIDEFEFEDRLFVIARIAPHPTAIRSIIEVTDDDEVVRRRPAELEPIAEDPYFWVRQYLALLKVYLGEVRSRLQDLELHPDPHSTEPMEQQLDPQSPIGIAARQSAAGVRSHAGSLAEAMLKAETAFGWPRSQRECAELADALMDATLAAVILDQLSGRHVIPDDVLRAWNPTSPDT